MAKSGWSWDWQSLLNRGEARKFRQSVRVQRSLAREAMGVATGEQDSEWGATPFAEPQSVPHLLGCGPSPR